MQNRIGFDGGGGNDGGNANYLIPHAKFQSDHYHHQHTIHVIFIGQIPFLLPNQQWSKHKGQILKTQMFCRHYRPKIQQGKDRQLVC